METSSTIIFWQELAKLGFVFLGVLISLITTYVVYRLGLSAYFKQKEYENVRKRYLEDGVELACSQIDYALGVYRHNWSLLLRILKQYRDIEEQLSIDDFFDQFIELEQAYFQFTPMHKIRVLLNDYVVWVAYQNVFSFVGTTNDTIKAEFGAVLKAMLEGQEHFNKEAFIEDSFQLAVELDKNSQKFSTLLTELQSIAEVLEQENLTRKSIMNFANRQEVKSAVQTLRLEFPIDDTSVQ